MKSKTILVNPKTPIWMDLKNIDDRSESHLKKWGNLAFIRTQGYEIECFLKYLKRMRKYDSSFNEDEIKYNLERKESYLNWWKNWPLGTRFDVRCLDGGAWDRTSWKGSFDNLEDAIKCAEHINLNN